MPVFHSFILWLKPKKLQISRQVEEEGGLQGEVEAGDGLEEEEEEEVEEYRKVERMVHPGGSWLGECPRMCACMEARLGHPALHRGQR